MQFVCEENHPDKIDSPDLLYLNGGLTAMRLTPIFPWGFRKQRHFMDGAPRT